MHATYELRQTHNKITKTTFNKNDIIIINIMTNDARQTNNRQRRTTNEVKYLQDKILTHLLRFVPALNVVFLESPPITNGKGDIYPYSALTSKTATAWGTGFAATLVGENHLKWDGFHIRPDSRYLLTQSIACAILQLDPHKSFGLRRPPYGIYGPWMAPIGQGMAPRISNVATAAPFYFRRPQRARDIFPLLDSNIQGCRW